MQPRTPYRLSVSALRPLTAAPASGADTEEVAAEPAHVVRMPGAAPTRASSNGGRSTACGCSTSRRTGRGRHAAQILGWLGADVIKVESVQRPDGTRLGTAYATKGAEPWEEAPLFHGANTGKRDITLDMTRPEGQALARAVARALRRADRELHPRVVERFGIIDDDPRGAHRTWSSPGCRRGGSPDVA